MSNVNARSPGRDYPKLRAYLQWSDTKPLDAPVTATPAGTKASLPPRVRPSAPAPRQKDSAAPQTLGDAARAALLFQPEPNRTTFDIALDEQLLGDVRCRISLGPEGIDALFVVSHSTERWLLDAEAPRLKQMLLDKGLTVRSVAVIDAADANAPDLLA